MREVLYTHEKIIDIRKTSKKLFGTENLGKLEHYQLDRLSRQYQ